MENPWRSKFLASVAALHGRRLVKFFVSRLPDAAEAPDMVQEVYLRLLRLERPELIRCPEAYLFTVAAHIANERRLRDSIRPVHVALDDTPLDELPADAALIVTAVPEDAVSADEQIGRLEQVLSQLSPKARAVLIWHRRDGRTYDEIGAQLGVSRNMVKKYLSQALAHCRKSLTTELGE